MSRHVVAAVLAMLVTPWLGECACGATIGQATEATDSAILGPKAGSSGQGESSTSTTEPDSSTSVLDEAVQVVVCRLDEVEGVVPPKDNIRELRRFVVDQSKQTVNGIPIEKELAEGLWRYFIFKDKAGIERKVGVGYSSKSARRYGRSRGKAEVSTYRVRKPCGRSETDPECRDFIGDGMCGDLERFDRQIKDEQRVCSIGRAHLIARIAERRRQA